MRDLGRNVAFEVTGDILTLTINLTTDNGRTKNGEGKNISVGSTGGLRELDMGEKHGFFSVGLNVTRKP